MKTPQQNWCAGYARSSSRILSRVRPLGGVQEAEIGATWTAFAATAPHVDIAEDEDVVVVKIGMLRHGEAALSAADALKREVISPHGVKADSISGNGMLVCLAKKELRLSVFKTMFAVPQLYYWQSAAGELVVTDNLGTMIGLQDDPQLDVNVLPFHMIYRSVPGRQTYLRDTSRLGPGEFLTWHDGVVRIDLRRDLRGMMPKQQTSVTPDSVKQFFGQVQEVLTHYADEAATRGGRTATLLSGGVDSSLLLLASATDRNPMPLARTITSSMASDKREEDYARDAAALLPTDHRFVPLENVDSVRLLIDAIEVLGQPPHHEGASLWLAFAAQMQHEEANIAFLMNGQGADMLHGLPVAEAIQRALRYRRWPRLTLQLAGRVLQPVARSKAYGARQALMMLTCLDSVDAPCHPANSVAAYTDWAQMERSFGTATVRETLASRREWARRYFEPRTVTEQAQLVDTFSDGYDTTAIIEQLARSEGQQIVFPFLDEAIISASLAFQPDERFYLHGRTKPVLKAALEGQTSPAFVNRPKLAGGFPTDLFASMRDGALKEHTGAIDRPAFMDHADFVAKLEQPDWFTWNLLTLDLWMKHALQRRTSEIAADRTT